eukprot:TRINITY_DN9882_c0_g3_i5.p1 TRINITY_DN9882_c0_g3~~TRINITY_DN9882_c0_g3_i5.p1  ORF type:complete len:537 (-),score=109.62 TRINITY_DN9882_c0_g3_i5:1034-2644(-)
MGCATSSSDSKTQKYEKGKLNGQLKPEAARNSQVNLEFNGQGSISSKENGSTRISIQPPALLKEQANEELKASCVKSTPDKKGISKIIPDILVLDKDFRQQIIFTDAIEVNPSSCLIKGKSKNNLQEYYIRYYPVKGKSVEVAEHKMRALKVLQMETTHLVNCEFTYCNGFYYYLIMENLGYKYLREALVEGVLKVSEYSLAVAMKGVFESLEVMHRNHLFHGNLMPSKLLLKGESFYIFDCTTGLESISDLAFEGLYYLAPEVLRGEPPSPASDVWAAGVILYYLLTGALPFPEAVFEEYKQIVNTVEPAFAEPVWTSISPEVKQLIHKMLSKDKGMRLGVDEILKSQWMSNPGICSTMSVVFPKEQLELQTNLMAAINMLANERGVEDLEQVIDKLEGIDYMRRGYLNLSFLLAEVTGTSCASFFGKKNINVNYKVILIKAITLNQVLMPERVSAAFYKKTKGGEYMDDVMLKEVLPLCGRSVLFESKEKFAKFIREAQLVPRREFNLSYREFLQLFIQWKINIPESFIHDVIQ